MTIALTGARLLDGTAAPPRSNMTVLIDGRSIAAVAPDAEVTVPPDALRYDLAGKTLMPGLIDGHVHLFANAGPGGLERPDFHQATDPPCGITAGFWPPLLTVDGDPSPTCGSSNAKNACSASSVTAGC